MSGDSSPPSDRRVRPRLPVAGPVLAALIGFAVGDALRPPSEQATARLAVAAIDAYRATVSPVLARSGVVRCRFEPTCSEYGREAITRYGLPKGFALAARRVLRCNPWAEGGSDPVP
jgi:uncharacterized protein